MLRLHQNRTQARQRGPIRVYVRSYVEERGGQFRNRQMEVSAGCFVKDALGESGGFAEACPPRSESHNIEFRYKTGPKSAVARDPPVQVQRRFPTLFQPLRELSLPAQR